MEPKIAKYTKGGAMVTVTSWRRLVREVRHKHKIMKFVKACARLRTAYARHNETLMIVHRIDVQMQCTKVVTESIKRMETFRRACI